MAGSVSVVTSGDDDISSNPSSLAFIWKWITDAHSAACGWVCLRPTRYLSAMGQGDTVRGRYNGRVTGNRVHLPVCLVHGSAVVHPYLTSYSTGAKFWRAV